MHGTFGVELKAEDGLSPKIIVFGNVGPRGCRWTEEKFMYFSVEQTPEQLHDLHNQLTTYLAKVGPRPVNIAPEGAKLAGPVSQLSDDALGENVGMVAGSSTGALLTEPDPLDMHAPVGISDPFNPPSPAVSQADGEGEDSRFDRASEGLGATEQV